MSNKRSLDLNIGRRMHVPDDDLSILGACDHDAVEEAEMKDGLLVVLQRLHICAALEVPDAHGRVGRAAHDDVLVVLEAEN